MLLVVSTAKLMLLALLLLVLLLGRYWHTNKALRDRDRWLTVKGEKEYEPKYLLDSRTNEVVFEVPQHYAEW
jgi:hypothetical protein